MKIIKFKKTSKDKYKLYLDNGESLSLFEDVIVNNNLLLTKQIDNELLDKLNYQNNEQHAYVIAIKYLSIKMRSKKEVSEYLIKKGVEENVITEVINRLIKDGYINDLAFSKAYVNDALLLSNDGPYKIKNNLIKYGVKQEIIDEVINDIDLNLVNQKLNNLIEKQIRIKKGSFNMIKVKLLNYFYNLGYDKENNSLRYTRYKTGKKIYRIPLETDYRIFTPVARDSKKFKTKYKMRTEIERLNGRIDRDYMFNDHFIRGQEKMELMLNLTFIVMLTIAKGHIKNKQENIRSLVA